MTQSTAVLAASADDRVLRLGIVGLGMAGGVMSQAVASHPGFVIAGAAEPNADLRARFAADKCVEVHADIVDLVRRDDVDVVYVASPHQLHRDHVVLAARHGKHVIVEKPMALSLDDCDAMIEAADRAGVVLIVGHTHGYDPALAVMRSLMRTALGAPAMIVSLNYTNFLYRPRRPEELDTAQGGGILFNQLPHQVDAVRMLVDSRVVSVKASASVLDPTRPTEGACTALLTFANGAAASLTYSGYDGFDSDEFHGWIGEGGRAKSPGHGAARRALTDLPDAQAEQEQRRTGFGYGSNLSAERPTHQPHFGVLIATCPGGEMRVSPGGVIVYDREGAREIAAPETPWRPGWGDVLETLRLAVVQGAAPIQNGGFARHTVEICLAVLRSSQEGCEVQLEGAA